MPASIAQAIVLFAASYLAIGLVFAIPFALKGVARIDSDAEGGTWGFRLLILPGATVLWPILARRWSRAGVGHEERSPHRAAAHRDFS
ncbi:MAG: hypothetical protein GY711_29380 [bacterium]|nr:hypothetical protein [bacterium]